MTDYRVVLLKILAMFLVILVGWVARRRGYLSVETTGTLSRFLVDLTIPALVLTQMLRTVDPEALRVNWYVPLFGMGILIVSLLVGLVVSPAFIRDHRRATFIFLVGVPNWIYLPLPIVQALYGDEGVRALLLFNAGTTLLLWTLGIWILRGGKFGVDALRNLVTNPGLIATVVGIVLALALPVTRTLETVDPAGAAPLLLTASAIIQALVMVGTLTIPLSLVVTGAQLGGLDIRAHQPSRSLSGVLLARLLVAPLAIVALVWLLTRAGVIIPTVPRMVGYIIAAMPVAVSCSIFTEHFGGDTPLAARAIFYSTLFSIASVPVLFYFLQTLGL